MTTLPIQPLFTDLYINGTWVKSKSGKTFTDICPITAAPYCEVAEGDAADIDMAVKAAREALDKGPWGTMSGAERGKILWRLAEELEARADRIIQL